MIGSVRGRTVAITGAARGIGEHVARLAAERGARVVLLGLEPDRLAALAAELNVATGGLPQHLWRECDVTDQAALDAAVDAIARRTGGLDVVVANAGIANLGTVAVSDVAALVRTIDVNLNGVIRTVAATLAPVRAARGYFLLVSSAAAFTALPGMAAYCAAKAGVEQFGTVLRMELSGTGVDVGTAHPGWIGTDLVHDISADLPSFGEALRRLPWPLNQTVPVRRCAQALVRAIERRSRRVYVPRSVAGVQALRTLYTGRLAESAIRRFGAGQVARLEDEARALGRSFGVNSMGTAKSTVNGQAHADQP